MRKLRLKKSRRHTQAVIIEMRFTLAGVFQLKQCIQETVRDSFKQRKLNEFSINEYTSNFRRGPMLEKTKMTNTKILKSKSKKDGNEYVTPE